MSSQDPIPQYDGPFPYRGPSMSYLMQHNQLAAKIIETHPQAPANILDAPSLALLRDFVNDPACKDSAGKNSLLKRWNLDSEDPNSSQRNLAAYAITNDKFNESEIEMLRNWFATGDLDEELKDVTPPAQE